jgi:hypothetical protein
LLKRKRDEEDDVRCQQELEAERLAALEAANREVELPLVRFHIALTKFELTD